MNDFNLFMTKTPVMYQHWFHYVSLLLCILLMVVLTFKYKYADIKKINRFLLISSSIMILFEIYKQINFTFFDYDSTLNKLVLLEKPQYMWYALPFQFCSVPMYIGFIASFTKEGKFRDSLLAFLATYGFFGGIAVMFYPETVYISDYSINVQTMVHHGLQAIMGIVILVNVSKRNSKSLLQATYVFLAMLGMAFLINTAWNIGVDHFGMEGTVNEFFLNKRYGTVLPLLNILFDINYYLYLAGYVFGFMFVAFLIQSVANGVIRAIQLTKNKHLLTQKHEA